MIEHILRWKKDENATSLMEAALLFPIFITLVMGVIDIGNGLMAAQKLVNAAQTTADLIARKAAPTSQERDEAIEAGKVAMQPYSTFSYKYDIVSVEFDENEDAQVVWRETSSGFEGNPDAVESTQGLGGEGEGALVVTIRFDYEPLFSNFLKPVYHFEEVAYTRGRSSPVIGDVPQT